MSISLTRLLDILVVLCLLGLTMAAVHFYTADRLGFLRMVYPLQAPLAKWTTDCSLGAPAWLRELANYAVDHQQSLANQVAFIEPDGSVHRCEVGWQGAMLFSPLVDQTTRFRYASLSKLFTADAVIAQVNAGRFALDSRLLSLLPAMTALHDERLRDVTVEQLLRHSWGFDRMRSPDPMAVRGVKPWCPGDVARLVELKLDFPPGERYAYSNLGYCLLGLALERATGKSYRALIEGEYHLNGGGMRFIDGPYLDDEVRYDFRNSDFFGETYYKYFDFPALSSAAGLSGSAVSLARSIKAMLERKPLNIVSARPDASCDPKRYADCYGFAVSPYRQQESLTLHIQGGLLFGAVSKAVVDSHGGVTVWLGSGMAREPGRKSREFASYLYGRLQAHYAQLTLGVGAE